MVIVLANLATRPMEKEDIRSRLLLAQDAEGKNQCPVLNNKDSILI
ncbi:15796_t:CDS:2 [Acaulospora colombiana]|uniref:15796_t:CDS:1 n=1 Tax=Acaulospora colombiana TaxID=27376 RepID=A0ACA9KSV3_9GLOM|nr:15796_t:CDS:2 [Acaulospora colombiana]